MSPGQVADGLECSRQAVRDTVEQTEIDAGEREGLATSEREAAAAGERRVAPSEPSARAEGEIPIGAAAYSPETNGTR